MTHENAEVIFVTDRNSQTQLFSDYISARLSCDISTLLPEDTLDNLQNDKVLILLDAAEVDDRSIHRWHTMTVMSEDITLAAINLREEDHAAEMLSSVHLKGIFYRTDSMALICKGISKLLENKLWMSRPLMTRMIELYQRQQLNAYQPVCSLTHREREIIAVLSSGASNGQIADTLFLSEHTIKSHLYNIFRKINVQNRVQAMNWARQHLGAPPPALAVRKR